MCLTHNVLWCIQVQTTVNKSCRRSLLLKVLICDGAEALRCVVGFANRTALISIECQMEEVEKYPLMRGMKVL